jgi:hypothetical protein
MAKKNTELNFVDIVLNANAETIRQALEAREQIDGLLAEREEAYQKIAEIEEQIETVVGQEGSFPFPAPPLPVAGIVGKDTITRKVAKNAAKPAAKKVAEPSKSTDTDEIDPASDDKPAAKDKIAAEDKSSSDDEK